MKQIFSFLAITICLFFSSFQSSFAQCNEWILTGGTDRGSYSRAYAVATDSSNVFVAAILDTVGTFHGTSIHSTTLTSPDTKFLFVSKVDSSGNLIWTRTIEATIFGIPNDLYSDGSNVYLTATFNGDLAIDGQLIQTTTQNILIVKFSSNGTITWFKHYPLQTNNIQNNPRTWMPGITVDKDGNVLLTGYISGTLNFGNTVLETTLVGGQREVVVLKLDSSGNELWGIVSTGTASNNFIYSRGWSITTDSQGDILIGGFFTNELTLGGTTITTSSQDISFTPFIAKIDGNSGITEWIRSGSFTAANTWFGNFYGIRTDKNDNVIAVGFSDMTITFGNQQLNNSTMGESIIIVKYDTNGNQVFARSFGAPLTSYNSWATDVNIDLDNNIYFSGRARANTTFDSFTMPNNGQSTFLATLDSTGQTINLRTMGGSSSEITQGAIYDGTQNIYLVGNYDSDTLMTIGTTTLPQHNIGFFLWKSCQSSVFTNTYEPIQEQLITSLAVNPNPNKGQFNVNITLQETRQVTIVIRNELGQILQRKIQNLSAGTNTLPLEMVDAPTGIYLVTIQSGNQVATKKFVKF